MILRQKKTKASQSLRTRDELLAYIGDRSNQCSAARDYSIPEMQSDFPYLREELSLQVIQTLQNCPVCSSDEVSAPMPSPGALSHCRV